MIDNEGGLTPKNKDPRDLIRPQLRHDERGITQKSREPLTGEETASVVAEMYEALGPTNDCLLVEPTAVLAVAGLKGFTFLLDAVIDPQETEKINAVNPLVEPRGIELWYPPTYQTKPTSQLSIHNLHGIARKTSETTISGVPSYDSTTGWDGYRQWRRELWDNLEEAQKDGRLDPDVDIQIYYEGIEFGYPDQAIRDFEHWHRTNGSNDPHDNLDSPNLLSVNPYAQQYGGPSPDFDYYPSSANDLEIQETTSTARTILDDFYKSEWHTKIAQNTTFLDARNALGQRHSEHMEKLRVTRRK